MEGDPWEGGESLLIRSKLYFIPTKGKEDTAKLDDHKGERM